ncbi:anti-sigma factor [Streptomyces sp. XD-27]|uniref:anti-sigma factor family protein n=1 Tax=Streptomyces sp. XD-27 TaxID=3062779 RepID=UPI0026F44EA1|nr:zf-HC2 domain-containing protein [Streptomyces sp. XD-27]WKX72431.1 zf-HC2 domain-containing protein [Streptomyces sp. XD-27]
MTRSGGPSPAEQHLGDRLSALVDGELGHDARERVLAHLATCPRCKAEADAQRQVKNVFTRTAAPPPSEDLLARLHGLPGIVLDGDDQQDGGGPDGRDGPFGGGTGGFGTGGFGTRQESLAFLPTPPRERGFRIHEVARPAVRGRRFAFAAAGAVSLAAFALGGTLVLDTGSDPSRSRAQGARSAVTPAAAKAGGMTAALGIRENTRREVGLRSPGDADSRSGRLATSDDARAAAASATPSAPPSGTPVAEAAATPLYAAPRLSSHGMLPPVVQPVLAATRELWPLSTAE